MFLPSCCLATREGYTYRHIDEWEGFMKYTVEIVLVTMMYIPSFIEIDSGNQKLIEGRYTDSMEIA
jgi:hypothetical protein